VLLKNVNDNSSTLSTLLKELVRIGVSPYYVFQCRPVKRVKYHFQVPIIKGIKLVEQTKAKCDGLSKHFKYIMSHKTGKIEILGILKDDIYFKYHQAKNKQDFGRIFKRKINKKAGWLDDF
jgi:L-lysine 2,3-aminomutase